MQLIIGLVIGFGLGCLVFYKFYHINVVTDLKKIIDDLKNKVT